MKRSHHGWFWRFNITTMVAIALILSSTTLLAVPISIDFESTPLYGVPSYTESGVTFTPISPATFLQPVSLPSGRGLIASGQGYWPIRADLSAGAAFVSVELGDNSPDADNLFLNAFDNSNTLIASASGFLEGAGIGTLSLSAADISYVIFGSASSINNSSVMVDTFIFDEEALPAEPANPVPEPATLFLLTIGMAGMGITRIKSKY